MKTNNRSLAAELLDLYVSEMTVESLRALTGLSEPAILTRLCAISRTNYSQSIRCCPEDGGLGVQWRFVYWRA